MNKKTIDKELQKYADNIKNLHDKLMAKYFSLDDKNKKEYAKMLRTSGLLYKAFCELDNDYPKNMN